MSRLTDPRLRPATNDAQREEVLVDLLRREAALRKSKKVKEDMEKAEASAESEWMDVIDQLQQSIVDDYLMTQSNQSCDGTVVRPTISVIELRLAALRHPGVAFWVKYNRARQSDLRIGEKGPNVPLRRAMDGTKTSLLEANPVPVATAAPQSREKPIVVFAGSLS